MQLTALTASAIALLLSTQVSAQQNLATCESDANCDFNLVCVKPSQDSPGTCEVGCNVTSDQLCPLGNRCIRLPDISVLEAGYCPEPAVCGGFAGTPCNDGPNPVCIDDPRDDCDPSNGGTDCGGICVVKTPSGLSCDGVNGPACPTGSECVPNPKFLCNPTEQVCQARCQTKSP